MAAAARDQGHDVTLGQHRPGATTATAPSVVLDMRDRAFIGRALAAVRPDYVVRLAFAGWDVSFAADLDTIVSSVVDQLEECHTAGVQRVVLASSIPVYENTPTRRRAAVAGVLHGHHRRRVGPGYRSRAFSAGFPQYVNAVRDRAMESLTTSNRNEG